MLSYFNIRKNELLSVLYGFIYSFFIVSFFILSKSYRDSLFLNSFGKEELSLLYIINPIIIGLIVWLVIYFIDHIELFKKSVILHTIIFIISVTFLTNLNNSLIFIYYIFVDLQISIIAFLFWRSLSNSFSTRQAKRLYGIITSGGFLSAIILGSSLSFLTNYISQKDFLIIFNFIILLCPFFTKQLLIKSIPIKSKKENKNQSDESKIKLLSNKYVINIISIVFLFTIISVIVDYYFKIHSFEKFSDNQQELTNYFAQFYSITSLLSFLFQFLFSSYVFKRFGVAYSLLILPFLLLLVMPFSIYFSSFYILLFLKGKEQVFKSTLHDVSMEILWMPLPKYIKDATKVIVNNLFKNLFSSIGGLLIVLMVYFNFNFMQIIPFLIILISLLIFFMSKSKKYYINELIRAIDDRSLSFENKNITNFSSNIEIVDTINSKIKENKNDRYFIIKLLDRNIIEKCKDTLMEVFYDSDIKTQKEILKYFSDDNEIISENYLYNQVKLENELSVLSLKILYKRQSKDIISLNEKICNSQSLSLKYTALNNCLNDNEDRDILKQIKNNINTKNHNQHIIRNIDPKHLKLNNEEYYKLVDNLDYQLILDSLKFIDDINDHRNWDCILDNCYKKSFIDQKLISFFDKINVRDIFLFFKNKIISSNYSIEKKIFIISLASKISSLHTLDLCNEYLNNNFKNDNVLNTICNVIINIKTNNFKEVIDSKLIDRIIEELNNSLYLYIRLSFLIDRDSKDRKLVEEYFRYRFKQKTEILIKLLYYNNDNLFKRKLSISLFSNELYIQKVIEIFEESLIERYKNKIIPLLDDISLLDKNNYSLKFYKHLKTININYLLETKMLGHDQWYDFISSFEVGNDNLDLFSNLVLDNRYFKLLFNYKNFNQENFLKKDNIQLILTKMITSLEKTLYLKDSSIFKDIPAKELIFISQELEEIQYSDNINIFKDGDVGDSMYFIFNGEVKISKGGKQLVCLKRGDYFGEMALLDGEPRSADATTLSNTVLLKLESTKFKNILYSNQHVIKGVLAMLCNRLRNANNIINQSDQ